MKPPSSFNHQRKKKRNSSSITTRERNTGFTQLYRSLSSKIVKRMTAPFKSIQTEARMNRGPAQGLPYLLLASTLWAYSKAKQEMYKQSVRTSWDTEIPWIHSKYKHGRKEGNNIHRQPDDPGLHKNTRIHTSLIDKIRLQTWNFEQVEWNVRFCSVKAHAGIQGNELADRLAKEAAMNADIAICYNKSPNL